MEQNCVDFYRRNNQYINDAIDRIVVELHIKKKSYNKNVILLTGCSSMAGVTSLSIDLAIALSLEGALTLLIDCDLRKSNKYKRLSSNVSLGLSDYLLKKATREEVIARSNYNFLDFISCGNTETSPVRLLCSSEMSKLIQDVKADYDYVIIDSSSINIVSDVNVLFPCVDGIVLVSALNKTTRRQLEDARRIVSHHLDKYYGLIVNKVDSKQYKTYIKDYNYFEKKNIDKKYYRNLKKIKKKKL